MHFNNLRGNWLSAALVFATGSAFLLFGYDQGVLGGLIENKSFERTFNYPNATVIGHITATYDLGCFAGAILCMMYGDRVGRRLSIGLGCTTLTIGAILQTASYNVPQMIVGRFVAGLGNGANTTAVPVWQAEVFPPELRGRMMVLQLVLNQLGNVTAQWLNFGLGYIGNKDVSWRFPLAFQIFYALATVSLMPWCPDSPRWLIQRGRTTEARAVLARLRDKDQDDPEIVTLHESAVHSVDHEMEVSRPKWSALLRNDDLQTARRVFLGAGTQFMQQWGGINVINYYLPVVFGSLNVSRRMSLILSACNAINLMFSACVGIVVIESVGRKRLMELGAIGQGVCFALVAGGLSANQDKWSIVAISFVFVFFTVFGLSWISIPWMYPAEVNTQQWRNRGAGIATATNWICNYAVVLVTPVGTDSIGWRFYIIFAVLNISFVPIVWLFYEETARRSLEDIDLCFEQKYAKASRASLGDENVKQAQQARDGTSEWDEDIGKLSQSKQDV